MKKILFIILFCAVFLCGCTQSTSGRVDELCSCSWSKTLAGGAEVRLSFDSDNAALTVDSAGEKIEIAGKCVIDDSSIVIFVPALSVNYGFGYLPKGDKLDLTYGSATITLEKEK